MALEIKKYKIVEIPINNIITDPVQPRDNFDQSEIENLSLSIKKAGLVQPITVFQLDNGNYQIIAGERRWRACKIAGFETIAALIESDDPERNSVISLIENVQRKDLTAIEKARGFMQILKTREIKLNPNEVISSLNRINESKYKTRNLQELDQDIIEISNIIGNSVGTIVEWIRTLNLDDEILLNEATDGINPKLSGKVLSRISTIEDRDLQIKVYEKIKTDKGSLNTSPSKFISNIKKVNKETQDRLLTNNFFPEEEYSSSEEFEKNDNNVSEEYSEVDEEYDDYEDFTFTTADAIPEPNNEEYSPQTIPVEKDIVDKPTIKHVDRIPKPQLYMEKNIWNFSTLQKYISFYTLGTDGKNINQFIELSKALSINNLILVDIRATPFSRYKPEFNKGNLQGLLQETNLEYIHLPELGVEKNLRNKLFDEEITEQELWAIYKNEILTDEMKSKIKQILEEYTPIFMCTEISPIRCHRHVIANWLMENKELGFDL